MNIEQQRIAIAEACGWTRRPATLLGNELTWTDPNGFSQREKTIPDYLGDLNAMFEAIRMRSIDEQWAIFATLADIVPAELPAYMGTPAQYAEAFLRTLNLWKLAPEKE